jgi:ferredoxin-NADP reductase
LPIFGSHHKNGDLNLWGKPATQHYTGGKGKGDLTAMKRASVILLLFGISVCPFEKSASFVFTAGQFIDMDLLSPSETDAEGNTRGFSVSSAPYEDTIMVATRLRDTAFKRVLKTMPLETEVKIEGPFGDLRLHNDAKRAAVFLAGGIGVTPFRSILLDAANRKLPHHIFLFFSNHRPEDTPFLDELQSLEKRNANYKFIWTMTSMEKSTLSWRGERGVIDKEMLDRHL